MHVRIQSIGRRGALLVALREAGWEVEVGQDGAASARHPLVPDEGAARVRLHHLGLLTSGSVRIEFSRAALGKGTGRDS
jgi:hypothetical protein